jgi:hypothetical protein
MGQYYKPVILGEKTEENHETVKAWMCSHEYGDGLKLMEHSYLDNPLMKTMEILIGPEGPFYKSRVVWAGDYADEEMDDDNNEEPMNLYRLADDYSSYTRLVSHSFGRYIVNHTKKLYVDKERKSENNNDNMIHPLPLLISEGNGRGGGDYNGNNNELCGTWARDCISVEKNIPDNYMELKCDFYE